jgi:hypothetical protein
VTWLSTTRCGVNPGAAANRVKAKAFAERALPIATALRAEGKTLSAIASQLTEQGIVTPRGGAWTATGVWRVLARVSGREVG